MEDTSKILFRSNMITMVIGTILLVLSCSLGILWWYGTHFKYVKGRYGNVCYENGHSSGNIKYPVYFKTLEECAATLIPKL